MCSSVKINFGERRDAEMIFNVQWKNKARCVDVRSNMVGLLDGSATSNYFTFKSYLLNNSGMFVSNVDNVRVSYFDGENEHWIDNQVDFKYALEYFRDKASIGQYIDIRLDYVDHCHFKEKESTPPEWFLKYMKKFKEEIIEEVAAVVVSKQHHCNGSHPTRKLKAESHKRSRKMPLLLGDVNEESLGAVKVQRKLDSKSDKLEHKSAKLKPKKLLIGLSSDSQAGKSSESETNQPQSEEEKGVMNAELVTWTTKKYPALVSGGEAYVHTWKFKNVGTLPWGKSTKLKYAWGSQALEPWQKEIACPPLEPGETCNLSVTFHAPPVPRIYECVWHFFDNGKRFGLSLTCVISVVSKPFNEENYVPSPMYDVIDIQDNYELVLPTTWTRPPKKPIETATEIKNILNFQSGWVKIPTTDEAQEGGEESKVAKKDIESNVSPQPTENNNDAADEVDKGNFMEGNKTELLGNEKLQVVEKNAMGDFEFVDESNDQSIISISDTESLVELFVQDDVPKPTEPNCINELTEAINEVKINDSDVAEPKEVEEVDVQKKEKSIDIADNSESKVDIINIESPPIVECKAEPTAIDIYRMDSEEVEDLLKMVNSPVELCETSKDELTQYAYIIYRGQKIPVPKQYLREDYLKTAEEVPMEVLPKINNLKIDSFSQSARTGDLRESSAQTGAIPKADKVIKKDKATNKPKPKSGSSVTPKKEKKGEKIPKNDSSVKKITKPKDEKKIVKKIPEPVCCPAAVLQEDIYNVEVPPDVEQRFFVFPQQSPGYEIVHHFPKPNGSYDCDAAATISENESVFVNVYVLYRTDTYECSDLYAYFVPLEHVSQYPPEIDDSFDCHEHMHYAIPSDVGSLINTPRDNPDRVDYRYVLLPLRQGILSAEFRYPPIMTENLYNIADLQNTFDFHKKMDHASTARIGKEHCVLTLNSEDYFVYEIFTVTRLTAFKMKMAPQVVIPQYSLKLYTVSPPSVKPAVKPKKIPVAKKNADSQKDEIKDKTPTVKAQVKKEERIKSSIVAKPTKLTASTMNIESDEVTYSRFQAKRAKPGDNTESNVDQRTKFSRIFSKMFRENDITKSVIDTAKEVIDIVSPPTRSSDGYWSEGHWISTNPKSKREQAMRVLYEMGFDNRDLNATLLARYNDNLDAALCQLLEYDKP